MTELKGNSMPVVFKNAYKRVLVFHHNDADGILSAFAIKKAYDMSLNNPNADMNVACIPCTYR